MEKKNKEKCNWKMKIVTALCLISILLVVIVSVCIQFTVNNEKFVAKQVAVAKTVLSRLAFSKITKTEEGQFDRFKTKFEEQTNWVNIPGKLEQSCNYATSLVKFYNLKPDDEKSKEYLKIANDVILKIKRTIFDAKDYSIIKNSTDFKVLSSLTMLLNTFEYLADDSYKDTKAFCHEQIIVMIPEYNRLHLEGDGNDYYMNSYESIYTITARLLTNFLYNKEYYNHDVVKMEVMEILKNQFAYLDKNPEKKQSFLSYSYYYNIYETFKSGN